MLPGNSGLSPGLVAHPPCFFAFYAKKTFVNIFVAAFIDILYCLSAEAAQIYFLHEPYIDYTQAYNACYSLVVYKGRCANKVIYDGTSAIHYWSLQPNGDTHNHIFFYSSFGKEKGIPPTSPNEPKSCAGNPIFFSTGNKVQIESDYKSKTKGAPVFSRSYNGLDGIWRHNYSTHLRITTNHITLVSADGHEIYFKVSNNVITNESIDLGSLSKTATGWTYTSISSSRYDFDTEGREIYWYHPSFGEYSVVYSGSQITVNGMGQNISFTEDSQHQPLSMTAGNISVNYTYNAKNRLAKRITTISGIQTVREYHYEDSRNGNLLTGITDERGVRYATWTYDDQGRAISSEHANGADKVLVSYNTDGSSTVTNELGKKTTYRFQAIEGIKHIATIYGEPSANCPNSNSTFTYDTRGLLKTKTDNKGVITTYDYNERGLEVSRTEAVGTAQARTTTTTWHATLNLPLTVSEPGRVTTYTYDGQGRQLSQTSTAL